MKHYLRFVITFILATVWCMGGYAAVGDTYEVVTDTKNLKSGDVVVIASSEGQAAIGKESASTSSNGKKRRKAISVTISNGKLTVVNGIDELILEQTETDKWYLKSSDSKYLSSDAAKTLQYFDKSSAKYAAIDITSNSDAIITFPENTDLSNNCIRQNGTNGFAYYAETTGTSVQIYKKTSSKTLTSLAISGEPEKKTYEEGKPFEPAGLVVTGTYDDKSTATITDGITWAMNPATLSLNDVSCSVTATVDGVTSPAYNVTGLTVNEAKLPSTTDATFGPDWDKLFGTSYDGIIPSVKANKLELNGVSNGVKIKVTNGTSTAGYVKTNDFRLYGNYTITITAPKDVLLSEITMTSQTIKDELKIKENKITSNVGSVKLDGEDLKWIGSSNEIQFEFSDKVSLSTIKVATKAAAAEPTYTPATVNFLAYAGAYYATFSNAKVVFMPKNITVQTVTVESNKITFTTNVEGVFGDPAIVNIEGSDITGYYIPANTGVLLESKDKTVTYYTVDNIGNTGYVDGFNMLQPAPTNGGLFTAEEGYKYYKLAYNDYTAKTGLGFYWGADNGGAFYVKAGTAYLAVPEAKAAGAKGFTLNGEATGIEGVNANVENAKAIYNLNGQRVASMAKPGLYIVNGKKVVRK